MFFFFLKYSIRTAVTKVRRLRPRSTIQDNATRLFKVYTVFSHSNVLPDLSRRCNANIFLILPFTIRIEEFYKITFSNSLIFVIAKKRKHPTYFQQILYYHTSSIYNNFQKFRLDNLWVHNIRCVQDHHGIFSRELEDALVVKPFINFLIQVNVVVFRGTNFLL